MKRVLSVFLLIVTLAGISVLNAIQNTEKSRLFLIFQNQKFGFMDRTGRIVIKPEFDDAQGFSEGLALVTRNGRKEFIDETGKVALVPKDFEPINGFTDGRARETLPARRDIERVTSTKQGRS